MILPLILLTPIYVSANTETIDPPVQEQSQLEKDQVKLYKTKALNPSEENKALKKLGFKDGHIKFNGKETFSIKFDDGSSIEYATSAEPTPADRLPKAETGIDGVTTQAAAIYKTYSVRKTYLYGSASAVTKLFTDAKHVDRFVYVRYNAPYFSGTLTKNDWQNTRTIDEVGYMADYATTELNGQFTLTAPRVGDYKNRTYLYRMDIDSAGFAYLRVIY